MKYLSLFSGIGGFEKGIAQAYESNRDRTAPLCIGFSEIDKYAVQIYQKHFNHKSYGDITLINENELPDFEFLCGGFPCQSFSIAGKRGGFNDTRGTMFFHIARILKAKRPRLLLLENVKGLLSHDEGRTFATIISALDELGYDIQWQVLNSKNFGVPQNRERVFIIGHLRGTSRPKVFPITGTNKINNQTVGKGITNTLTGRNASNGNHRGNLIQKIGGSQGMRVYDSSGVSTTIAGLAGGWGAKTGLYAMRGRENGQQLEYRGNETNTLTSVQKDNLWVENMKIRRLTPTECERLQGFPDGWTEGVSDTQKYKCLGNAVTVNVIKAIIEKLLF